MSGSTVTITVNGSSSILIASQSFNISSSNYITAYSMSAAIGTISGVTSTYSASSAAGLSTSASYVYVIPSVGTYALTLATSMAATTMSITSGNTGNVLLYGNISASSNITASVIGTELGNKNLSFITSGSTIMFISSSGNVGIGTTAPGAKLDVTGIYILLVVLVLELMLLMVMQVLGRQF